MTCDDAHLTVRTQRARAPTPASVARNKRVQYKVQVLRVPARLRWRARVCASHTIMYM